MVPPPRTPSLKGRMQAQIASLPLGAALVSPRAAGRLDEKQPSRSNEPLIVPLEAGSNAEQMIRARRHAGFYRPLENTYVQGATSAAKDLWPRPYRVHAAAAAPAGNMGV